MDSKPDTLDQALQVVKNASSNQRVLLGNTSPIFLGKRVNKEGISLNPEKITAVKNWPTPANETQVESFLGFVNYHRDHIKGYASIAAPLYGLTGSKGRKAPLSWDTCHQTAFDDLKKAMTHAPVLSFPKADCPFILDTDASDFATGAELIQVQDCSETVVCYGSYSLTPAQKRYCTTCKELLALVCFTRQYQHYLLSRHFTVRTDDNSLT